MSARKRPIPVDAVTARQTLPARLARDADIFELLSELAPLPPRDNTFPGEVFLHVAADALDWCGASRADPLPLEGLRERFLPKRPFRGRQKTKFQYAVLAAAALHGGTEPDLLDEVACNSGGRDVSPGIVLAAARGIAVGMESAGLAGRLRACLARGKGTSPAAGDRHAIIVNRIGRVPT
jgi:hypothetical protein